LSHESSANKSHGPQKIRNGEDLQCTTINTKHLKMEDEKKPIKVPENMLGNIQKILDEARETILGKPGEEGISSSLSRPFLEWTRKNEENDKKKKEDYRMRLESVLNKFKNAKEKIYHLEQERNRLEKWIMHYSNVNQSDNYKQTVYLKDKILFPYIEMARRESELELTIPKKIIADVKAKQKGKNKNTDQLQFNFDKERLLKLIDHLITVNKFTPTDRTTVIKAFYSEENTEKITWLDNANIFLTILYDLQKNNLIKSDNTTLTQWVIKYFNYNSKQGVKVFQFKSVYETFNESKHKRRVHHKSPKYIDVVTILESTSTK
jgi:hypothetical protein